MKQERSLKKVGDDFYELRVNQPEANLLQVKGYKKSELKELYEQMKTELAQLKGSIAQLKKKLEIAPEWTKDELDIKVVVEKVLLNQQFEKDKQTLNYQQEMLETSTEHLKEIENAVPELKRNN